MLMGRIRLSCISRGSSSLWGQEIRNAVLTINTRFVKIHGYLPAKILLGFNASTTRNSGTNLIQWSKQTLLQSTDTLEPSDANVTSYMDVREEMGQTAGQELAWRQDDTRPKKTPGYQTPKPGDLLLLRAFQQAKDKGRKLDPRWSTPRILERVSKSGVSGHLWQIHDSPGHTNAFTLTIC